VAAWSRRELRALDSMLRRIERELAPFLGKDVPILCCGAGQVFLWLGARMAGRGRVVGLDLSDELLEEARRRVREGARYTDSCPMQRPSGRR
jgi:ubiquinone/menaquinone biosynthesis C-methylase UbiE